MAAADPGAWRAIVLGCAGPTLTADERALFAAVQPLGFILFGRNCERPDQVSRLVADLRAAVGRDAAPVLIDQEGGRVQRLGPPHWRAAPPAAAFGALADRNRAREATRLNARLIAHDLAALGIDVDCAPVLDVPATGADAVIGDRAFGPDPAVVADLGRAFAAGLVAGGVAPVIKHVPGHGRAEADSHRALPVVAAPREALARSDFAPFRALADAPWAMTAHVVYAALDDRPATLSPTVIAEVIRGEIGFSGALLGDDLSMAALTGRLEDRAAAALAAGCDAVLHCTGDLAEMRRLAAAVGRLSPPAAERVARALAARRPAEPFDPASGARRLAALMADASRA